MSIAASIGKVFSSQVILTLQYQIQSISRQLTQLSELAMGVGERRSAYESNRMKQLSSIFQGQGQNANVIKQNEAMHASQVQQFEIAEQQIHHKEKMLTAKKERYSTRLKQEEQKYEMSKKMEEQGIKREFSYA